VKKTPGVFSPGVFFETSKSGKKLPLLADKKQFFFNGIKNYLLCF